MSAAAVIDLEAFRRRRNQATATPAAAPPALVPLPYLVWQPAWVWFWYR